MSSSSCLVGPGALASSLLTRWFINRTTMNNTQAMMVPLSFVGLNILESYIVTPLVLGHRLTLNPVVVFLGLTFWGWLWGITGALLAVPIMVVLKIICDHSDPLRSIGEFLGD